MDILNLCVDAYLAATFITVSGRKAHGFNRGMKAHSF